MKFNDVEMYSVKRITSSCNGNPRFEISTSSGIFKTKHDAALGYGIENLTNPRFPDEHLIGNEGVTVTLVGDNRDSIYLIEK